MDTFRATAFYLAVWHAVLIPLWQHDGGPAAHPDRAPSWSLPPFRGAQGCDGSHPLRQSVVPERGKAHKF